MKIVVAVFVFFALFHNQVYGQPYKLVSKTELSDLLNKKSDKVQVINFWASWCAPCVAELPDFVDAISESDPNKVEYIFVSLDFLSSAKKTLPAFLKRNNYNFNVLLISETDHNSWIEMVDKNWGGSIPATLFINNSKSKRHFINGPIDKKKILTVINSIL